MQTIGTYFVGVVRSVFDSYFEQLGAWNVETGTTEVVRYCTDRWFAEPLYLPEDGPRFSPRLEIGVISEMFVDPRRNRVDIMHTVPATSDLRQYNMAWKYSDSDGATWAFTQVRDRILRVYAEKYLKEWLLLAELTRVRCREIDQKWHDEIDRHNDAVARQIADPAFRARDYRTFVEAISRIPRDRLSPLEVRKLEYSASRLSQDY